MGIYLIKPIMNWIDILTVAIVAIAAVVFALRGREFMGAALFDMVAFVVAALASRKAHVGVAAMLGISTILAYIILFVVIAAILLFVSSKLHQATQWDFHPFNGLLSFFFGVVAGWALAFVVLDCLLIGYGQIRENRFFQAQVENLSGTEQKIYESRMAEEVLTFRSIVGTKQFMDTLKMIKE
jgi:hypothetical protein